MRQRFRGPGKSFIKALRALLPHQFGRGTRQKIRVVINARNSMRFWTACQLVDCAWILVGVLRTCAVEWIQQIHQTNCMFHLCYPPLSARALACH